MYRIIIFLSSLAALFLLNLLLSCASHPAGKTTEQTQNKTSPMTVRENKTDTIPSLYFTPAEALQKAVNAVKGDTSVSISLPFPCSWPPAGPPHVIYFAYRVGSPTDSGDLLYHVTSPHMTITIPLLKGEIPGAQTESIPEESFMATESVFLELMTESERNEALEILFSLMGEERIPAAGEKETIQLVYTSWINNHLSFLELVRSYTPDFIDWLYDGIS